MVDHGLRACHRGLRERRFRCAHRIAQRFWDGTQFVGRHTVSELLDHDYDVTLFNRGNHDDPFAADPRVDHVQGDRTDESVARTVEAFREGDGQREAAADLGPDRDAVAELLSGFGENAGGE